MKIIITIILLFLLLPVSAYAQTSSLDTAYGYTVIDPSAKDGDILIYADKGLTRATSGFSTAIFGVIQNNPIISIQLSDNENQPVIRSGIATVNITNKNGVIKKGDYITSSTEPGKGQKADKSGYMLGVALTDSTESGQIQVALDIKYVDLYSAMPASVNKFLKSLDSILLASTQDPEKFSRLVRYLVAALIVLGAFVISFLTFTKSMTNSVEAIGRNPLARRFIYFSLMVNVGVTVVTLIIGVITAYILIRL